MVGQEIAVVEAFSHSVCQYSLEYSPHDVKKGDGPIRSRVGARLAGCGDHDYGCILPSLKKVSRAEATVENKGKTVDSGWW